MTVYYWEDGPRARFEQSVKSVAGRRIHDAYLSAYGEGVILEGTFTLAQIAIIYRAMRKYEQEIAEAKAYVAAQREA